MLFPFFVLGGWWFGVFAIMWFCTMVYAIEKDSGWKWPTTTFVLAIAIMLLFGTGVTDVLHWMRQNPMWTGIYCIVYFLIGAIFAGMPYGKWYWFVHDTLDANRECRENWLASWKDRLDIAKRRYDGGASGFDSERDREHLKKCRDEYEAWANCDGKMTAELLPLWKEYEKTQQYTDTLGKYWPITKPELKQHKSRIISWIVYWPPVLFWSVLNDPLRRVGRVLFNMIKNVMQHTTDSAWRDEDVVVASAKPASPTEASGT